MRFCKKSTKKIDTKSAAPDARDFALEQSERDLKEVQARIELIRQNIRLVQRGEERG